MAFTTGVGEIEELPSDRPAGIDALFVHEYAGLARLAFLLTDDASTAEELAMEAFARALAGWRRIGSMDRPDLYLRRGLLLLDQDDLQGARGEFLAAVDEASRSSFTEGRQEVLVNSYNNLGIVAWRQTNYSEALHWLRLAEEEQTRSGANWLPDLTANRKRLEAIIASLSSRATPVPFAYATPREFCATMLP